MTAPTPTAHQQNGGSRVGDAAHTAQDSGQAVAGSAAEHAKDLTGSAVDKASDVVADAGDKARDLVGQAREQVASEAETRRGQAVTALRALGDELDAMQQHDGDKGVATDLAGRGSGYVTQTADWLDGREPAQILDDVRSFARRRPGTFLVGALVAGVVAGRLTRAVKAGAPDSGSGGAHSTGARHDAAVVDPGFAPVNDRIATDLSTPLPTHAGGTL